MHESSPALASKRRADHLAAQGAIEELSRQIQIQLGTMWAPFETIWNPTGII